jgi:uncharacterized protein YciI
MYWVIHCLDKPDRANVRQSVLDAHLAYVGSASLPIALAGPLMGETGQFPSGSLLIVEAEQRSDVEAFARAAPFSAAGIWENIQIDAFMPTTAWPSDAPPKR